jgi:NAD(P)-dependent dehydrogenase (short-subunit alcohol dehydrogenase family)
MKLGLMRELTGKTGLVTGASGRLGAHFGKVLAREGAHTILAERREDALMETVRTILMPRSLSNSPLFRVYVCPRRTAKVEGSKKARTTRVSFHNSVLRTAACDPEPSPENVASGQPQTARWR